MKKFIYKFTRVFLYTFMFLSFYVSAQMQNLHNGEEFEFHGVGLGMTAKQAQQGIVDFYSVDEQEESVKRVKSSMPITDLKNATHHVRYRAEEHVIDVKLTPSLDARI